MRDHRAAFLAIVTVVVIVTVATWVVAHQPLAREAEQEAETEISKWYHFGTLHAPLLIATSGLSTISTTTVVAMIALLLARPAWCPALLCPQPPGPHDQYLEADFTAFESADYVIDGDPGKYSLKQLPVTTGVAAVPAQLALPERPSGEPPYKVVVRIHSLQQGRFGMVIEGVGLVLTDVKAPPDPLRVWEKGAPLEYQTNPHDTRYTGQPAGEVLHAAYAGAIREGHVQLSPGESDELTIQLDSDLAADLRFKIAITYRPVDQAADRTLTLPYQFRVVFSEARSWQPYRLENGRLARVA
jgi:hypothetical protein